MLLKIMDPYLINVQDTHDGSVCACEANDMETKIDAVLIYNLNVAAPERAEVIQQT
jgi:hypothetical protein